MLLVGQLALVDQQAGVGTSLDDLVQDLVERHRTEPELLPEAETQHEEGGRHHARDGDLDLGQLLARQRLP